MMMSTNAQSLSQLQAQRDALTIKILCQRFSDSNKPTAYLVSVVVNETQRGLGSLPRSLRNKSYFYHCIRKFREQHNREPRFEEILGFAE
jgi:hypothetical protein